MSPDENAAEADRAGRLKASRAVAESQPRGGAHYTVWSGRRGKAFALGTDDLDEVLAAVRRLAVADPMWCFVWINGKTRIARVSPKSTVGHLVFQTTVEKVREAAK